MTFELKAYLIKRINCNYIFSLNTRELIDSISYTFLYDIKVKQAIKTFEKVFERNVVLHFNQTNHTIVNGTPSNYNDNSFMKRLTILV